MKLTVIAFCTITAFMALPTVWANPRQVSNSAHSSKKARHHASLPLTKAQRNNGFTNPAYAEAYDAFGREILRRDRDVKETSESVRDAYNGYYVILKGKDLSGTEAKRRTARYYAAFVSMRQQYFGPAEAPNCSLDLKDVQEQTVASEDQEELRLGP